MSKSEGQQRPFTSGFAPFSRLPKSPKYGTESPRAFDLRSSTSLGRRPSQADKVQEEAYFTDLLSYSLERLGKEPDLLTAERDQLKRQSQDSAVQHYRGFIEVARCLTTLKDKVAAVSDHLDVLERDLPGLDAACEGFTNEAKQHTDKRGQNKQLLKQHGVLLEILELPSLMDSCLRSGSYDDALDLRAFVSKIALLHPDLPVVQSLVRETEERSKGMLQGLLARLRSNIQLPECLRVVAHLRRLATFPEAQLRQTFLQCREQWLAELVAALDESNAYDYLKRLTDVHRLQLFDVVMQFRAIFSDESTPDEDSSQQDADVVYGIFYIEALAKHLPRIQEGGGLASVLEHCMYCGMSLGRVGLDFRGLLPPIFEACILGLFTSSVQSAVENSLMMLNSHKWIATQSSIARRTRMFPAPPGKSEGVNAKENAAPYALLDHPPLAVLTNGLLSALNELRHCAPLSLQTRLATVLQEALQGVVQALNLYKTTRNFSEEESKVIEDACKALTETACPYVASCFAKIFAASGPAAVKIIENHGTSQVSNEEDTVSTSVPL